MRFVNKEVQRNADPPLITCTSRVYQEYEERDSHRTQAWKQQPQDTQETFNEEQIEPATMNRRLFCEFVILELYAKLTWCL